MIAEAAKRWFESRREELNRRFERQRRQFPTLDPQYVLALTDQIIPPLAGDEPEANELCLNVFELILLHAARNSFAVRPGIKILMCEAFPRLRALFLKSPRDLPGSLCNATENLGRKGAQFAERLGAMAHLIAGPENLLAAGALLAWRLGEARLRTHALAGARSLPPRMVLEALDLSGWPDGAVPLALAALEDDGWRLPGTRVSSRTLDALAREKVKSEELIRTFRSAPTPHLREWKIDFHVGDFSGLDGSFDSPPAVLNGGDRHTFLVRSGQTFHQLAADCFGWVCRTIADPELGARMPGSISVWSRLGLRAATDDRKWLSPDGELSLDGESARFDALKEATSFAPFERLVAFTTKNSYRIRILLPPAAVV
jgi:hypothetical protein